MIPKLNLTNFYLTDHGEYTDIVDTRSDTTIRVDIIDTVFLRCIDGKQTITEIHQSMQKVLTTDIPKYLLWRALDVLSDIGLLELKGMALGGGQKISRRGFLKGISATPAIAATAAIGVGMANSAYAQEAGTSQEIADKRQQEISAKELNQKSILASRAQESNNKRQQEVYFKNNPEAEKESKQQEQTSKANTAEQNEKAQAASQSEQSEKSAEQAEKQAAESASKPPVDPAEQESKQAEQNGKRLAEQQAKTQTESGNKEALAKNVVATGGSVDDKPTVAVNAPTSLSLLGLGAVAAVWLKRKREQQG